MTVSQAQQAKAVRDIGAIALLIDLAERGEIDPWDVQVIDVIDRALSELAALNNADAGSIDADLSQSGQAFLDAAVLVLLKAKTLERLESPLSDLDSEAEADLAQLDEWGDPLLPRHLERQLRRRPAVVPPTHRRVTLQELIDQLRLVAAAIEQKPPRVRPINSLRSQSRAQLQATMELANEENSTEIAAQLEELLTAYWSVEPRESDLLDLEQLLWLWFERKNEATRNFERSNEANESDSPGIDAANGTSFNGHPSPQEQLNDRVNIFWALLLLSAQSKVELVQEEFYQDLKIRTL